MQLSHNNQTEYLILMQFAQKIFRPQNTASRKGCPTSTSTAKTKAPRRYPTLFFTFYKILILYHYRIQILVIKYHSNL